MTGNRLAEIRARRERLVARSAVQRDELALLVEPLSGSLRVVDRGVAAVQYLRQHPGAVLIAVAVFVALSPKRALRLARRAFGLWRGYRFAVRVLERVTT